MTQQPFSRPGAVDLTGLANANPDAGAAAAGAGGGQSAAYVVEINEENFQQTLENSRTAPVILTFYSPSQSPESTQLANDMATLSTEFDGKFLAGQVNVDAVPSIAQAMQIPSIPLVVAVIEGRPAPLLQEVVPLDQLREALTQVFQQLTAQGVAGKHQPQASAETGDEDEEQALDPRYVPAQDALEAGDIDKAVEEYQKLVDGNAGDTEAIAGLAMAKVLQRTQGVDLNEARQKAADNPDDVAAQTMAADLDLLGGHVDDAFARLIEFVRRSVDEDRNVARQHLVDLFTAVGNDDDRVLKGRAALASALF